MLGAAVSGHSGESGAAVSGCSSADPSAEQRREFYTYKADIVLEVLRHLLQIGTLATQDGGSGGLATLDGRSGGRGREFLIVDSVSDLGEYQRAGTQSTELLPGNLSPTNEKQGCGKNRNKENPIIYGDANLDELLQQVASKKLNLEDLDCLDLSETESESSNTSKSKSPVGEKIEKTGFDRPETERAITQKLLPKPVRPDFVFLPTSNGCHERDKSTPSSSSAVDRSTPVVLQDYVTQLPVYAAYRRCLSREIGRESAQGAREAARELEEVHGQAPTEKTAHSERLSWLLSHAPPVQQKDVNGFFQCNSGFAGNPGVNFAWQELMQELCEEIEVCRERELCRATVMPGEEVAPRNKADGDVRKWDQEIGQTQETGERRSSCEETGTGKELAPTEETLVPERPTEGHVDTSHTLPRKIASKTQSGNPSLSTPRRITQERDRFFREQVEERLEIAIARWMVEKGVSAEVPGEPRCESSRRIAQEPKKEQNLCTSGIAPNLAPWNFLEEYYKDEPRATSRWKRWDNSVARKTSL